MLFAEKQIYTSQDNQSTLTLLTKVLLTLRPVRYAVLWLAFLGERTSLIGLKKSKILKK